MSRRFPIYTLCVEWIQDSDNGHRIFNSMIPVDVMFREHPSHGELSGICQEKWKRTKEKHKDKNISNMPIISWRHRWDEEWCCVWFNHYTFDDGQSDDDVLMSFASYVDRIMTYNRSVPKKEQYCLMGAEDRYRWSGVDGAEAPCRCGACKKSGLIYINH